MKLPPNNSGTSAPVNNTAAPVTGNETPQQQQAAQTSFDANGSTRISSPKVAVHITPLGGNGHRQQQTGGQNPRQNQAQYGMGNGPGQVNNQQQSRNNQNWNFGGQPNRPNNNQNQQQYRVNDKLVLDFGLLDNAMGQRQQFVTTKLGGFLDQFVKSQAQHGLKMDVTWDGELGAYYIKIGQAQVLWVSGMVNPSSPGYTLPTRLGSWPGFEHNGSSLTQFAMRNFNQQRDQNGNIINDAFLVIYDDDIEYNFVGVAYLITKAACPDLSARVTEDQFLNRRNGFNIVDTNELAMYQANPQYIKEIENQIREFINSNSASAIKRAGDKYVAISVTDSTNNQWMNYGGGFNGGGWGQQQWGGSPGGLGFGSAFGGFGQNGGFGVSGYQQPRTKYIAAMRYYITQEPNMATGAKVPVIHITEICELGSAIIENWIKYILVKLNSSGSFIQLDLDIGKLTQNMRDNILKYFTPAGGYGGSAYKGLTSYVNRSANKLIRISPSFLTLPVFKTMYPDYEKDTKFPKDLSTPENRRQFEEYKRKEGYVQYLDTGTFSLYFDSRAAFSIQNDYDGHQWAASMNMTFDEAVEQQRRMNNNPNQQPQQQQNFQQGWGNGGPQWGQQGFYNGNQWGQSPWGNNQNGWNNGFQQNNWGGQRQYGYQQPYGGSPLGPMPGNQPYPVQQGRGCNMNGQMPYGANPYMGSPVMGNRGYGPGPMGYPQGQTYQPGTVAGGAFPGNTAGGYIPN